MSKLYYMFDGNDVNGVLLGNFNKEAAAKRFNESGIYKEYNEWVVNEVVEIVPEGEINLGLNLVTTIYLNNRPKRAFVNISKDGVNEIINMCDKMNDEYRKYTWCVEYVEFSN